MCDVDSSLLVRCDTYLPTVYRYTRPAAPIVGCPIPRWARSWQQERSELSCGFRVPSADMVTADGCVVQLWEKKWPKTLLDQVVTFATAALAEAQ